MCKENDVDATEVFPPERIVNELFLRFSAVRDHRQADAGGLLRLLFYWPNSIFFLLRFIW